MLLQKKLQTKLTKVTKSQKVVGLEKGSCQVCQLKNPDLDLDLRSPKPGDMLPASSTSSAAAAALHLWFCRHGPPVVPSTRARRRNLSSYRPPPRDPGDPYRTLGLPRSASRAEVKAAYYSLSKRFHPDLNPGGEEEAAEKFRAVKEAYEVTRSHILYSDQTITARVVCSFE